MLQERFREFARDTGNIGQERVDGVNRQADELINSGHGDAATIAEWKDGLNEAWADLLELIDTRTQILSASYELHKFYHDAKEILNRILDKHKKLPEELGRDQNTVETLQRMHTTFEHDIQALGTQVRTWKCMSRIIKRLESLFFGSFPKSLAVYVRSSAVKGKPEQTLCLKWFSRRSTCSNLWGSYFNLFRSECASSRL